MRRFPTRRRVLAGAGALGLAACTNGPDGSDGADTDAAPDDTDPPEKERFVGHPIVYIYVDQLRWDAIGSAGNPVVLTPNIDAIAAEGVRFSTCITNGPSCRPARVTMMTGLHVHQHGARDNYCEPNPNVLQSHVTRMRDEAGYFTMVVGKTHLQDAANKDLSDDALVDVLKAWGFTDAVELPDPQMINVESAHSHYLQDTTPVGQIPDKYGRWQSYVRDYEWWSPAPDTAPWNLSTADHLDTFCGRTAADFIRAYGDEKPLYIQVNFPGPHKPFDPTTEFKDLVDPDDPLMPLPILEMPQEPLAPLTEFWGYEGNEKFEPWTEQTARNLRRDYYAKVALVDAGIGEVIAALKDTGLWDEAWIIVHSDHGELLADHFLTGKVIPYDPSIRVPLIVRPPGGIAAWVDDGQVDQMDMTATLLAIGGLDPKGFGDRSLLDRVLDGPEGPEAHQSKTVMFENLFSVGLRTPTHKMTYDLNEKRSVELYDLVNDPDEKTNLVEDPTQADLLTSLEAELSALGHPLEMDDHPPGCSPSAETTSPS